MSPILLLALGLVVGAAGWTLLEYIIHYPLGHLPRGKTMVSSEHLRHHREIDYFSPLRLKVRGAVPVVGIVAALAWLAAGPYFALGTAVSVAVGWTTYEALHKAIHVRGPHSAYGRWAARHHLYHHFMRPDMNHGVTTPIWDIVFRTYVRPEKVELRAHEIAAIPWLAQAFANQESSPAFLSDYSLRTPKSAVKKKEARA